MSPECPHCGLPSTKKPRRIPTQSANEPHLGTNTAFTAHDGVRVDIVTLVADAKADIADLDRNIEKLETALAAAKKERDQAIAFRDAHLALCPPIHRLPTEVLLEIFHLTFEKPYNAFASYGRGPWLLGKVCHWWRQVTWSCPSLWTDFTLTNAGGPGFHEVGTQALFEGALSRSANCNRFHIPFGGLKKTQISLIAEGAESWYDASFEGSLEHFEPLLKIDKMPSLVALGIDIQVSYSNLDAYYQLLSSLGKHIPQLCRLTLAVTQASGTGVALWTIGFPLTQLTELVIPLDRVLSCQQLLICCPDLETLRDNPHLSRCDRVRITLNMSELHAVVHSKLTFIDMSPSLAITLLDVIRCPALTRLSLPCPRANWQPESDGDILQRFIQRSECTITTADLTFNEDGTPLVSPETSLSALSEIVDLKLSFSAESPKGRLIECLSDRAVVPKLRVLTITSTTISRPIWETEFKDTLIRVLSARFQSPDESNLQQVVVVLGRETYMIPGGRTNGSLYYLEGYSSWLQKDARRLPEHLGGDCTIADVVNADFIEFRKLKERGLDIRLSVWKGRTLIRYV